MAEPKPTHQIVDFGPGTIDQTQGYPFEGTEDQCEEWLARNQVRRKDDAKYRYGMQEIPSDEDHNKGPLEVKLDQASHGDCYCIQDENGRVWARTPGKLPVDHTRATALAVTFNESPKLDRYEKALQFIEKLVVHTHPPATMSDSQFVKNVSRIIHDALYTNESTAPIVMNTPPPTEGKSI